MAEPLIPKDRIPWRHLVLFAWLPSPLKVLAYRLLLGYRIGRGVRFSLGGVVVGQTVEIGDHVTIGFLAVVQGRRIRIGRFSSIGTLSYIACETIEIGEDARIREQVYVGGPQLPESRFVLGSRTIVLQFAFINPTKPVTIGDDTAIGGHTLIFTHGVWLSALDGYPVSYEPVTVGNSVWLPWRVFVMPGTTIGDGTVVGGNSLVSGAIPPDSVVMGFPARVIKAGPDFPRQLTAVERSALVAGIMAEFDRYVRYAGVVVGEQPPFRLYTRRGKTWRLLWLRDAEAIPALGPGDTVLSEAPRPAAALAEYRARGVHWLDLGGRTRSRDGSPLTEELAQYIGRHGIRLKRDG